MSAFGTHTVNTLSVGIGLTRYVAYGGILAGVQTTEGPAQIPVRTAGTASGLFVRVSANANTAITTVNTRKTAANANQSLSIDASLTGDFQDNTNTDSLAAGDKYNFMIVTGATGSTFTASSIGIIFSATTNSGMRIVDGGIGVTTVASTRYGYMGGSGSSTATETSHQFKIKTTATLKSLAVWVNTNGKTGTATYGSRKNTANGALTLSVTAGSTGLFEDTTHSDSLVSGDLSNYFVTTLGSTGNLFSSFTGSELTTTTGKMHIVASSGSAVSANLTRYAPLWANGGFGNTVETDAAFPGLTDNTLSNLEAHISANTVTAATTLTLRNNGSSMTQTVSIASSTTGYFEDTTHSDNVYATDDACTQMVTGATGTSITLDNIGYLQTAITRTAFPKRIGIVNQAVNRANNY